MKKIIAVMFSIILLLTGCTFHVDKKSVNNDDTTVAVTSTKSDENKNNTTEYLDTEPSTDKLQVPSDKTTGKTENLNEKNSFIEKTTIATKTTKTKIETSTNIKTEYIKCTIEIECKEIIDNIADLKKEKNSFVPQDGYILNNTELTLEKGSTVFDALKKICNTTECNGKCSYCKKNHTIQLEYIYTPAYDSQYIRGIHQIYEKDCGTYSGWTYYVNDVFPNYGCNKYVLKNNDNIRFSYTCSI